MSESSKKPGSDFVRIDLSDVQREKVREQTGKDADAIELTVNELEERIAPRVRSY